MRDKLNLILRLGIGLGLIFILFRVVPYRDVVYRLKQVDIPILVLSFAIFFGLNIIGVFRWKLCLATLGLKIKFNDLFFLIFCGLFFNLIFPSVIGQDIFRGGLLGFKEKESLEKVAASLVIDRFSGFLALALVALGAYVFGRGLIEEKSVGIAVFLLFLLLVVVSLFIFSKRFFNLIRLLSKRFERIHATVSKFGDYLYTFRRDFTSFFRIFLLSFVIQLLVPVSLYLIAFSFGARLPITIFFILIPIIIAVSMIPVTVAGLGTREAVMIYFFSKVGMAESVALGTSLMQFFFILVVGLFGGVLYVTFYHRRLQSHRHNPAV